MQLLIVKGSEVTPYVLSQQELEKYSREFIFRAGKQYPSKSNSMEEGVRQLDVPGIHIVLEFNHHKKQKNTKELVGRLVLCEHWEQDPETKKLSFYPPRMPLGSQGFIKSSNPYDNFFLDNHPSNEVVANDSTHVNHEPGKSPYFATYQREKVLQGNIDTMKLAADMTSMILDKTKVQKAELEAIVNEVKRVSVDYNIVHRLHANDLDELFMRQELARLCQTYPLAMQAITQSANVDYEADLLKMKELGMVVFVGDEWRSVDPEGSQKVMLKVPMGADSEKAILAFFKNTDRKDGVYQRLKHQLKQSGIPA